MSTPENTTTGVIGLNLRDSLAAPKKQVYSWALWDWATQPFHTVIVTFIFTALYLTTDAFLPPEIAALDPESDAHVSAIAGLTSGLGLGSTIAGIAILLLAPVLGQRADAAGRQRLWLGIGTGALIICMFGLWFVEPTPSLFWLGVALISVGALFSEIAVVNSNAMLVGISNTKTVGRISGLGWGLGYIGGLVALVIVIVFFMSGWFALFEANGLAFRMIAVGCAIWAIVFSIPIFLNVPEPSLGRPERRVGFFRSYVLIVRDVIALYRTTATRSTFWFLIASAIIRDGLGGILAFGAVIASAAYGFDFVELVLFALAASLVAGVATLFSGRLDDRYGPKRIILISVGATILSGMAMFMLGDAHPAVFWTGGLVMSAFAGPANASSRSFLARVTPAGREGEIFGLYATTGRAASWMASAAWTLLIVLSGTTEYGILGIMLVLIVGFILLLPVKATPVT